MVDHDTPLWTKRLNCQPNFLGTASTYVPMPLGNIEAYTRLEDYAKDCVKEIETIGVLEPVDPSIALLHSTTPENPKAIVPLKLAIRHLRIDYLYPIGPHGCRGLRNAWNAVKVYGKLVKRNSEIVLEVDFIVPVDDIEACEETLAALAKFARTKYNSYNYDPMTNGQLRSYVEKVKKRKSSFAFVGARRKCFNTSGTLEEIPDNRCWLPRYLYEMRLMQRLAISGLLSVMLIVLLTGTFMTRRDLASVVVERGTGSVEPSEQSNPAWVQENAVPSNQESQRRANEAKHGELNVEHRLTEASAVEAPVVPETTIPRYIVRPPNPPLDDVTNQRREKVKEMMKHGWDNYVRYAWGKNELKPISKKGHNPSIFGMSMGATIIDGLDTLYIMGLHDEFKHGRDWIAKNLDFDVKAESSLFETNIRFLGSLLACYALTGDVMFRDKAAQLGERLLPAFQTETGIPHSLINLATGASRNYGWASSGCSILSEIGTLHLEFTYLSDITGNPVFRSKVEHIRKVLNSLDKPKGLYPNYIHPKTGQWGQHHMSLGGLGDSFYEYLLKAWIQSGMEDVEARTMWDKAMTSIEKYMIMKSPGGLLYVSDLKYDRPENKMGHLACFAGGMFALGAKNTKNDMAKKYMNIAAGLTNTCHESYDRTVTKLGPEVFHFIEGLEAKSLKNGEKYYILRPETFESYFVMWRLTNDTKYREWGWEAVQALEKHCRVPGGFTGLHNVYMADSLKDDVQQSYFFAETLKYLYLLFSDNELISLDDWVFNSEAHVLPIRGNPLYRAAPSL